MSITYESTSRVIEVASRPVHLNEAGEGSPLVLLHGSGPGATGWSNYSQNIPALARHHRVLAVDMPGWGRSAPATAEERRHPETLVALLDALGIERAAIVGNSMGGGTAIRFAYEYPDRTAQVITMGASTGNSTLFGAAGSSEGLRVLDAAYRHPDYEHMRRLVDIMTFDSSFASDALVRERATVVAGRPDHNANFLDGLERGFPVVSLDLERVAGIAAPVLLFHGRDDRVVHFEHSLRLVSLIPNSRLHLINRCGHWLQIEHAEEFDRLVLDFLATGEPPAPGAA